jgi:tetratricopeptide (TPR) repeat protein
MRSGLHRLDSRALLVLGLFVACLGGTPSGAQTEEEREHQHLTTIEHLRAEQGETARELIQPLLELGQLYLGQDRCQEAIAALEHAFGISRKIDGLFHPTQLKMIAPLRECYVALDLLREFERVQQHAIRIAESQHGQNDLALLPALDEAARWYEHAGLYKEARDLYSRSMRIVRKAAGDNDVRLIEPLRGMARACRLENQFQNGNAPLDALGERSLRRAVAIARAHPEASRTQRVETFLELADWLQMTGYTREALKIYKEVWNELAKPTRVVAAASGDRVDIIAGAVGTELLSSPLPIQYRTQVGVALRRPPPPAEREKLRHYTVDFSYTVTREGYATDIRVLHSDAPRDLQYHMLENLRRTRFRPRFEDGVPVETRDVRLRQGVYVGD